MKYYFELLEINGVKKETIDAMAAENVSHGLVNYAVMFLDQEVAYLFHEDKVDTIANLIEYGQTLSRNEYNRERLKRSLTKENFQRRFSIDSDYAFLISDYDENNQQKRILRFMFLPVEGNTNVILWSIIDVTQPMESDVLTGGLNREGLLRRLREHFIGRNPDTEFAIVYFNICDLRRINELYGIETGDIVLQHFYTRMSHSDLLPIAYARSHSDSFYCLIDKKYFSEETIAELCHQEINILGKTIHYRLRCGIYFVTDYNEPVTSLIGRARLALRNITHYEKKPWRIINDQQVRRCIEDSDSAEQIQKALKNKEFVSYFQPIVDARTERIAMAEALTRWNSERYGLISPSDFLPSLERNGEITQVDAYMCQYVYEMQRKRIRENKRIVPVDINLSWADFENRKIIDIIKYQINDTEVPVNLMRYEITENTVFELTENNHELLETFKNNKTKLIIDDFGKGYSFASMSEIDFNIVKLDKSLINNIGSKKSDFLIESLVGMFHKMNAKVIAEGVELLSQVEFLRSVGCDYIQGFYYFKPLTEEEFCKVLDEEAKKETEPSEEKHSESMWIEREVLEAQYNKLKNVAETQTRLRHLLEEMDVHYFEWDVKTHIDRCSKSFAKVFNLPSREIPNMPEQADLCYPEDRERFRELYYRAERGEKTGFDYIRIVKPDGNGYDWYRKTFYTLFDKDNKPFKVILTMQECTEKFNNRALQQRDDLLIYYQDIITFKYNIDNDVFEYNILGPDKKVQHFEIPDYMNASEEQKTPNQRAITALFRDALKPESPTSGYSDYFDNTFNTEVRAYYTTVKGELGTNYAIVGHMESIMRTREKLQETIEKQHEYISVIDGLSKVYTGISIMNVESGESKVILLDDAYTNSLDVNMSWDEAKQAYAENYIELQYKQRFLEFMNRNTIASRIGEKKSISLEYVDKTLGWIRGFLIPSKRDENGNVTDILFASLPIGTEKSMLERLIHLSETDGLTNLRNRTSGEREIENALLNKQPGTFAIIDCDKFKFINDTFGHTTGDSFLVELSNAMKEVNPDGINMRLGGDEFAMYIFGETTTTKNLDTFESLFDKVKQIKLDFNSQIAQSFNRVEITPSISVGAVIIDSNSHTSFDKIYSAADALLYQSKKVLGCRVTM